MRSHKRAVKASDGRVFSSMTEAAAAVGRSHAAAIHIAITKGNKCAGLNWSYLEENVSSQAELRKAYRLVWDGTDDSDHGIYAVYNQGQARMAAAQSIVEVGYAKTVRDAWRQIISCRRAPEYDEWAAAQTEPKAFVESYVKDELQRMHKDGEVINA